MLTTARCCQGVNPDQVRKNPKQNLEIFQVQVVAGKHNIFLEEEGQQVGNVEVIKLFVAMVQKIKFLKTITRDSQTNVQCAGVKFLVKFGSLSKTQSKFYKISCQGDYNPPRLEREQYGRRHLSDWDWVAFWDQLICWICEVLFHIIIVSDWVVAIISAYFGADQSENVVGFLCPAKLLLETQLW